VKSARYSQTLPSYTLVMWSISSPNDVHITQGAWWPRGTTEPVVSIDDESARILGLKPGDVIQLEASGKIISRARWRGS